MTMCIVDVGEDGDSFVVRRSHNGDPEIPHVFPKDTLEWRAAEYGLDPEDVDALIRIVLYEPLLPDHNIRNPKHLYNALSIAEARTAHLAGIDAAHKAHPIEDPGNKLDFVRRNHWMHPEAIQLKRESVAEARRKRPAKTANPHEERLERLRATLGPPPVTPRDPEAGLPPDTNALLRKDRR